MPGSRVMPKILLAEDDIDMRRFLVKALQTGGTYNFSLNICDVEPNPLYRGNRVWGLRFGTHPNSVDAVNIQPAPAARVQSLRSYPNPFNVSTTLLYSIPWEADVEWGVYDMLGREVSVLVDGRQEPGYYSVRFDGSDRASGVYLYRLTTERSVATKKLMLVK